MIAAFDSREGICLMAGTEGIKIFFAETYISDIVPDSWMSGMAKEKRNRILMLANEKDRRLAVTAHRLLCFSLHKVFGTVLTAEDWARGWHGKPYLKRAPHVHFNISHSGKVAMCALHSAPVGADVELIKTIDDNAAVLSLSDEELKAVQAAVDKDSFFYKIWTMKEAYVKFCGRGLGGGLKKLTVYPYGDDIISNVSGCKFALIDAVPGYQAAVCAADATHSVEWVNEDMLQAFENTKIS